LYSLPNIRAINPRWMRWARHVARAEEMGNAYKIMVEKSEENGPLRKLRHKWEDKEEI
jgi:hypothetical protein